MHTTVKFVGGMGVLRTTTNFNFTCRHLLRFCIYMSMAQTVSGLPNVCSNFKFNPQFSHLLNTELYGFYLLQILIYFDFMIAPSEEKCASNMLIYDNNFTGCFRSNKICKVMLP